MIKKCFTILLIIATLIFIPSYSYANITPANKLYAIKKDSKYGFANSNGKIIVYPSNSNYDFAMSSTEGLAYFHDHSGKSGYINLDGNVAISLPPNSTGGYFCDGIALIDTPTKDQNGIIQHNYSYINKIGKVILDSKGAFIPVEDFSHGYGKVSQTITSSEGSNKTLYGFINNTGKVVIQPKFIQATSFIKYKGSLLAFAQLEILSENNFFDEINFKNKYGKVSADGKVTPYSSSYINAICKNSFKKLNYYESEPNLEKKSAQYIDNLLSSVTKSNPSKIINYYKILFNTLTFTMYDAGYTPAEISKQLSYVKENLVSDGNLWIYSYKTDTSSIKNVLLSKLTDNLLVFQPYNDYLKILTKIKNDKNLK